MDKKIFCICLMFLIVLSGGFALEKNVVIAQEYVHDSPHDDFNSSSQKSGLFGQLCALPFIDLDSMGKTGDLR